LLAYNSLKTPVFDLKYLTKYNHKTFFEEYMNFQNHYLSRCRVIPLQSFGSHIRPQLYGLGLKCWLLFILLILELWKDYSCPDGYSEPWRPHLLVGTLLNYLHN
jgi:hypothetical protein